MLDKDTVRAANLVEVVIPAELGVAPRTSGRELLVTCPWHDDGSPSLRINPQKQVWRCDPCDVGGDVFAFVQKFHGLDFPAALRRLAAGASAPESTRQRQIVATYDYHDECGRLLFQAVRFEPKDFRQRRPDGKGGWTWNVNGTRRVPYRLNRLQGREAIVIVEGEKDVDALLAHGIPATTNPGGAGKWTPAYSALLRTAGAKRVAIIPDNDDPGRAHAESVAAMCSEAGLTTRIVKLPDVPPKGDVSDFLERHTREELLEVMKATPPWKPSESQTQTVQPGPVLVCLADVQPQDIEWVWENRIARGWFGTLVGDPGVGKSTMTIDIAARITRGAEWPDGGRAPAGNVILLACEDALAVTVRPRLDRQGGDASRVTVLKAVRGDDGTERDFSIDRDLPHLAVAIKALQPILVVIDPLSAYFGTEHDSYKDTEVRAVLKPLARLAEDTGTAILGLMHMNKSTNQKALYRGLGGIGFIGASRISLAAGKDPNADRCFLMAHKQNDCPASATLAYQITSERRLVWESAAITGVNVDHVLSGGAALPDEDREDAAAFLRELLADGPMAQTEIEREGKGHGFSISQLRRAKRVAGVESEKSGFRGGVWLWRLEVPKVTEEPPKMTFPRESVIFGENQPVTPLDSTGFPKMTAVSPSPSPSTPVPEPVGVGADGWSEV